MMKILGRPMTRTLSSLLGINFLISGLSFVSTLSIAVAMGSSAFGIFSYALALGGYMTTITNYGAEQTLVRDLAQNPDKFDDHLAASYVVRCVMLAIAFVLLMVENTFAEGDSKLALAGLAIAFLEGIKCFYIPQVYDVWGKMERHAVYYLAERVIYFAIIWLGLTLLRPQFSLQFVLLAMGVSTGISFFLQYAWALPRLHLGLGPRIWPIAKAMWKDNFWIWIALLSTLSFGGLSKLVLQHVSGSSKLGEYSVAWQIVTLGSLVTTQTGRIGYPKLAQYVHLGLHHPATRRFLAKYFGLSTFAATIIGLPAILFPELLLRALGPQYHAAAEPLRILGLYVILLGVGQVGLQFLIASKRGSLYATITIVTGALSPLLYAVLVPRWSAMGAAAAVVIAHGLAIAIYSGTMLRQLWSSVPPVQKI